MEATDKDCDDAQKAAMWKSMHCLLQRVMQIQCVERLRNINFMELLFNLMICQHLQVEYKYIVYVVYIRCLP